MHVYRLHLLTYLISWTAVAPKIAAGRTSAEMSVSERRPVTMVCDVSGVPAPTVTWSQDGVRVSADGRRRLLKGGAVLQLTAALVQDAGLYVCTAENVAGVDRRQFRLQVLGASTDNYYYDYYYYYYYYYCHYYYYTCFEPGLRYNFDTAEMGTVVVSSICRLHDNCIPGLCRFLGHVRYMLSPVRLSSVCNARAPYSGGSNFR